MFFHKYANGRMWLGQHTAPGATKEKTQRLDELKAKRKAKDDKRRVSHPVNLITPLTLPLTV